MFLSSGYHIIIPQISDYRNFPPELLHSFRTSHFPISPFPGLLKEKKRETGRFGWGQQVLPSFLQRTISVDGWERGFPSVSLENKEPLLKLRQGL